jgi:divalent metal cation (Fe/Co/Zn/Cd) transporter
MSCTVAHRHGVWTHTHHHHGSHRHGALPFRSHARDDAHDHGDHDHQHHDHGDHDDHDDGDHDHEQDHGHTHGRVDRSIVRSRAGVRAVSISLAVLGVTAALQAIVFTLSGSVALLADLIHNGGDALTAIPLAIAFLLRSERGERWAGYAVVLAIFVSASVAAIESVDRLLHPQHLHYLGALAAAGVIGFVGNELAARVRLRAGRRLDSPALLADGQHARVDGFVSLGVVASAGVVALGLRLADPLIGLAITALILRITLQAWRTIRAAE